MIIPHKSQQQHQLNDWRDKTMIRPVSDIIRGRIELSFSHSSLHILVSQSLINYKLRYWRKLSRSGEYHSIFWGRGNARTCYEVTSSYTDQQIQLEVIRDVFTGILNKCYKDDQISGHKGMTGGPWVRGGIGIGSILVTLDLFTLTIKCVGEGGDGGGGWWWYWNILTIQG